MNEEVKAKWLEALRGGKYSQVTGTLHHTTGGEGFCCLGVLCETLGGTPTTYGAYDLVTKNHGIVRASGELPFEFCDELGLARTDMQFLIRMNDTYGNSFNEIADYIESNL